MPELPEVETVRRGLAPIMEGRRLVEVTCRRCDLRFPLPAGFVQCLMGRRIAKIDRRGKFLLFRLDGGMVMLAHLGMSGRFQIGGVRVADQEDHIHVVFEIEGGHTVLYRDPRRFGFMDLIPEEKLNDYPMLARLGPEPLTEAFTADYLQERLEGRVTPIKSAILDQGIVAGIGNIYASESLFRAGISPNRMARTVVRRRAERLVSAIKAVLNEAIAAGGSSLCDHRTPGGDLGMFQHDFAVYGRAGEACPGCTCDVRRSGGIRRIVQAGRSTFYCAKQQR